MSYDVYIRVDHQDGYISTFEVGNMTSNVTRMTRRAAQPFSFADFDGMKCTEARPILEAAWREMRHNPSYFERFEVAEWGALRDFMPYLKDFYRLTRLHPRGVIRVSY